MGEQPKSVEDIARPQTSTRDLDEVRARLERWLGTVLPPSAAPSVLHLHAPESNGMSSETLLFDARWDEGGGATDHPLVARVAPQASAVPVFPVYDLPQQYEVMRKVRELAPVPVPRVLWSEPSADAIGAPFFVMERVDGEVPPDVMPYNFGDSWLFDASPSEQRRLQDASIRVLAELHAIPNAEAEFPFLQFARPEPTALGRHVGNQKDFYAWAFEGRASRLLDACFAWLDGHWPSREGETVLSWGDARIGNTMYRDFAPVAVLDWEMAALGPREIDLAWFFFLHQFFEDIASTFELPGMPHFLRRDDVASTYEELTGYTPRDLDFYTMYAAVRHGIVMARTKLRQVHFGEEEMPADVDDLIMHRAMLESMLDGTYWS
ncbi:MAG: phosphotransferase family protein [Actinobacteria bacterium]|nr:phosphotransferase family protein [Actinomycetota bacterium]